VSEHDNNARVLNGTAVAADIRETLRARIEAFGVAFGRTPRLGILLAGDDPGSALYVRNKMRTSEELGMTTTLERLPETASLDEAMSIVWRFNGDPLVDGILVQSPLPSGMGPDAEQKIFDAIDVQKDVDGFHPTNVGRLVQARAPLAACTPSGVIELLDRSEINLKGKQAVVIGRSDIVGKPMALLLLHRHATVTVCHSRTTHLAKVAAQADVLVAAIGRPAFVTAEFIKRGATVIDVGTNALTERSVVVDIFGANSKKVAAFDKRGQVWCGDVHPEVASLAGALTPVPGGVGPLTIAMLMSNTVTAAEIRCAQK
jgi:methylenetetrahydrofolate dehydrogenase (NADP+)/methenyltetrahydrofolate cyclohydrolase|tara:strand:- start:942 stop:1889 length:948 start_codon:yes stop_codon:yes gene_type:complete